MMRYFAWSLLLAPVPAQEHLWSVTGVVHSHRLFDTFAVLDDLDRDGEPEIAVQAQYWIQIGGADPRVVMVLSGATGRILRMDTLVEPYQLDPNLLARAGDMDGDGVADYAVGRLSLAEVYSGATGARLWRVEVTEPRPRYLFFGQQIASDLDVNGDGRPDLLVLGEHNGDNRAGVYAYDSDGKLLYRAPPPFLTSLSWAYRIAALGDVDGDGCDDFAAGPNGTSNAGHVWVFSGRTGAVLRVHVGRSPTEAIGLGHIGRCGDIDVDGVEDYAASSPAQYGYDGVLIVWSGRTGSVLRELRDPTAVPFAPNFAAGDLDADGIADLAVVAAPSRQPEVTLFSGRDGARMGAMRVANGGMGGARPIVWAPRGGDGFGTVVGGERGFGVNPTPPPTYLGRVSRFRGVPASVQARESGCAGTLVDEPRIGFRLQGSALGRVHLTRAPAGATAILLIGIDGEELAPGVKIPPDLAAFGLPQCALANTIEATAVRTTGTRGVDLGYASVDVPMFAAPRLYAQWLVLDPASGGVGLSRGLVW